MRPVAKYLLVALLAFALGGGSVYAYTHRASFLPKPQLPPTQAYVPPTPSRPTTTRPTVPGAPTTTATSTAPKTDVLPKSLRLSVPFIPQAPKQNWDLPYQEACEEASILMVDAYYKKESNPTAAEADTRILDLVAWSAQRYGPERIDTDAEETGEMAEEYFTNIQADVVAFKDAKQIKEYLAKGYPVIIPADGKTLPNPNFRNGGPPYHMLVVKGYTADGKWITNDPGTRLGENFLYEEQALMDSIRDWNGGDVKNADPVILVLTLKT